MRLLAITGLGLLTGLLTARLWPVAHATTYGCRPETRAVRLVSTSCDREQATCSWKAVGEVTLQWDSAGGSSVLVDVLPEPPLTLDFAHGAETGR